MLRWIHIPSQNKFRRQRECQNLPCRLRFVTVYSGTTPSAISVTPTNNLRNMTNSCRSIALWVYQPSHVKSVNEVTESNWIYPFLTVISFMFSLKNSIKIGSLLLDYRTIILSNEIKELVHLVYRLLLSFRLWCIPFFLHLLPQSHNRFRTVSSQQSILSVTPGLITIIFSCLPAT